MDAQQLQQYIEQQSRVYQPDYWPLWLIILAVIWLILCGLLLLHGWLRYQSLGQSQVKPVVEQRTYLYSLPLRLWHGCNGLLFLFLLVSGVILHFQLGSSLFRLWLIKGHQYAGYLLLLIWLCFLLLNSGTNGRHYRLRFKGLLTTCIAQATFYLLGITRGEPHPFPVTETDKFNPLQKISYILVGYVLLPLLIISGITLCYPQWLAVGMAYWILKLHLLLSMVGLLFITLHLYLCTTGDTPGQLFRCMWDGYHRHRL